MQSGRISFILVQTSFFLLFSGWQISPAWPDADINQPCRDCHLPHPAHVTNEVHPGVDCRSCHLEKGNIYPDPDSGRIRFKENPDWEMNEDVHDNLKDVSGQQSCGQCHFSANPFGAAAIVLPPKSFLCLPCHAATFSATHPLTLSALVIFGTGFLNLFIIWIKSSGVPGKEVNRKKSHHFIKSFMKAFIFMRSLFAALLINQRLFRQSPGRWIVHGLMIYPLMMRCLWGFVALAGSLYAPQWDFVWPMLDRDYPATALFFDLTGILIFCGFILAVLRHWIRPKQTLSDRLAGLPQTDWIGFLVLGLLVASGFVQEALRLAMVPSRVTQYAFVGHFLSRMINGSAGLTDTYADFWYVHFILTAGLVAYLPFSRFKHMLMSPISIAIQSVHTYNSNSRTRENKGD